MNYAILYNPSLWFWVMVISKFDYSQIQNIASLMNMPKSNFRASSSQGHVIHKVDFKVKHKAQRSYDLLFSKEGYDKFRFLVKLPLQPFT